MEMSPVVMPAYCTVRASLHIIDL